jgi:hypothetical protein
MWRCVVGQVPTFRRSLLPPSSGWMKSGERWKACVRTGLWAKQWEWLQMEAASVCVTVAIQFCRHRNCITLNGRAMGESWVEKDLEGSTDELMRATSHVFVWKDRNTTIYLLEDKRFHTEMRTSPPPSQIRVLERYRHTCVLGTPLCLGLALLRS